MSSNINKDKETKKVQYELMVKQELSKITFNINVHKEVLKVFLSTIVSGFFFTWCSSSEESFLPVFIKENQWAMIIICSLPIIIALIYETSLVMSARNIRRKIDFEMEMSYVYWKKIYQKFILDKIGYKKDDNITKNLNEAKRLYKNQEDIYFFEDEFSDYLYKYYLKYHLDVSYDFYKNLAKVILLENEINGTLISEENDRYTFIVKDNIEFLLMPNLYV